jgi:hypothetical protein
MEKKKRTATILTVDLLSVNLKRKARAAAMKAYPEGHAGALSQWVRKLIMEAVKGKS